MSFNKDEAFCIAIIKLIDFFNSISMVLRESNPDSADENYCVCLFLHLIHIYYNTDAPKIAKNKYPQLYQSLKEIESNIDWSFLNQPISAYDPIARNDNRTPSGGPADNSPRSRVEATSYPDNDAEIENIKKELGEHLPMVNPEPFDPNHDYWGELNQLVGLQRVKEELASHIMSFKVQLERQRKHPDLKINTAFNCIFKGRPGTGKTTVARLVAGILRKEGLLSGGHCIETSDQQLCSAYIGESAKITKYVSLLSKGGVLFIDEAYNLANHKGEKCDVGKEVIDTLTPLIENSRNSNTPLTVILAGYEKEMDEFLSQTNTGFASRFQFVFHFDDYSAEEMYIIFCKLITKNHYTMTPDANKLAAKLFQYVDRQKAAIPTFANARTVRTLFETITRRANLRYATCGSESNPDLIVSDDLKLNKTELQTALGII